MKSEQNTWEGEWNRNKLLIQGTAFLANALLSIIVFIGVGLMGDMREVKDSSASILNKQIEMETNQKNNSGRLHQLESEFNAFQKEYYLSKK